MDGAGCPRGGARRLDKVAAALEGPLPVEARVDLSTVAAPEPVSNTTPEQFGAMVARAKEYIVAGDVFQVVLSQRFEAPFTLPAFALYRSLRRTNRRRSCATRFRGVPDRLLLAGDPGAGP